MKLHQINVNALFNYDPETGALTWRANRGRRVKAGTRAGTRTRNGIIRVGIKGYTYMAAKIIWLMQKNEVPEGQIKFRDGDTTNLSWDNMYHVPRPLKTDERAIYQREYMRKRRAQAARNRTLHNDNPTSINNNVFWNDRVKRWEVGYIDDHGLVDRNRVCYASRQQMRAEAFARSYASDALFVLNNIKLPPPVKDFGRACAGRSGIPLAEILDTFIHNPRTGKIFLRHGAPRADSPRSNIGIRVDKAAPSGNRSVSFHGFRLPAASLAWFLNFYEWPDRGEMKHLDGNVANNKRVNLKRVVKG